MIPQTQNSQLAEANEQKKLPGLTANYWLTIYTLLTSEWLCVSMLVCIALIPRLLLAQQLDLVTDEIVYIMAGKAYIPLLLNLHITSGAWSFNYEHPPVVKLLVGLCLYLNAQLGSPLSGLFAARLPSIGSGIVLIGTMYWLGRAPFGRVVAFLAAFCLAVSPWLVYFSALAYLDMTMTAMITLSYLVLWSALRQPRLYLVVAALLGLAVACKYTAALALPGVLLFIAYQSLIRPACPRQAGRRERQPLPWSWWLAALVVLPVTFFVADPAIWRNPFGLLLESLLFEWHQSVSGHLTFLAGQYAGHAPHWAVPLIVFAKLSAFVTLPALFFSGFAAVHLLRYHLAASRLRLQDVSALAFLFTWLVSLLSMFSMLNIVVGTHYLLPLAPPLAFAGAFGLVTLAGYCKRLLAQTALIGSSQAFPAAGGISMRARRRLKLRSVAQLLTLLLLFGGPHLLGLMTVKAAEGYTSEFFHGEDAVLQVAYPGYREAGLWLMAHTHSSSYVGLVALLDTLDKGDIHISWYRYNQNITGRLLFREAQPDATSFPYDYLVWPMHLVQRGYIPPAPWRTHVVHAIAGGDTMYCYILARDPATIS